MTTAQPSTQNCECGHMSKCGIQCLVWNSVSRVLAAFAVLRTGLGRSHPLVSKLNDSLVRGRAGTLISSRAKGRIDPYADQEDAACVSSRLRYPEIVFGEAEKRSNQSMQIAALLSFALLSTSILPLNGSPRSVSKLRSDRMAGLLYSSSMFLGH
jgi:hypothetical protein